MGANVVKGSVEEKLLKDIVSFSTDPYRYCLYNFPWGKAGTELATSTGPRAWQRRKLEAIGQKLREGGEAGVLIQDATVSGHGVGKSALVAMISKWALDTKLDTRVVVTANTERQLQTKTWPELAKWHRMSLTRNWFDFTATSLYSVDGDHEKTWRADAIPWSENNTEAFAGLHNEGRRIVLVFDEAAAIPDRIWEVAEGALTDTNTEILWLVFGNGTRATGQFRECFRRFRHRWVGEHIDSREVEGTNLELFRQQVEDYGEDSDRVKVRVRGMFPSQSLKQFISEDDVDRAFSTHLDESQYNFAPVILSVDPAWEGDDLLVIGKRQGLRFQILKELAKNDNDVWVAQLLAKLEDEHKADAVFIDAGYGTGIVSAGTTMGRSWQLVWFAEKPTDYGYLNKRAEMWGGVKEWLKSGGSLIGQPQQLRDDLIGPETVARMDGKVQLESKKDMKARGIPSPNYADALALTFAYPVGKRDGPFAVTAGGGTRGHAVDEWEPWI